MHVAKPSKQWLLPSHMHGRRSFEMPQPARADSYGPLLIDKHARYVLVNFLRFSRVLVMDLIAG